ncbi:hypothetical protein ILUMI_21152 [Ignelater luminosus]|uniref:Polyprotein n=1 Tax=Ignelater luminosus TaxID=2038154 RepID=A0A8K0CG58_IGNLU|nr:hypothetical protein ILUMI_21152 [Ignelater luminosus]
MAGGKLKLEERGTLNSHFLTFDSIVRSLIASGVTLEENDIICHLLLTLPKSYETVITAIETIRGSDLTLEFVKGKLPDEEIKQKSKNTMVQENSTAFAGKSKYNKKKWNMSSQQRYTKMANKSQEKKISVAKCDEAITALKAGNIRGYLVVNGKMVKCTIKNVLFVPNLQHNLISITRLERSGLKTVFENSKAVIYKRSKIVGVAKRQHCLYELEIYLDMKTANANLSLHEKGDLWHKRCGHIGNESLQKIINLDMINGIEMLNIKNTEKWYAVNGYQLWNPQTDTIINGRDVIFVENKFMFSNSNHIDESFEEEREVEVQTDEESGKEESARNTRERRKPTWFDDYDMSCLAVNQEPEKFKEIVTHPQRTPWEHAMENKMQALVKNRTNSSLPECKKAIDCKWVYKIKVDGNGDTHYKDTLVAKGFQQNEGMDFEGIYAPVARLTTIRT